MYDVIENEVRRVETPTVTLSETSGVCLNKASAKYFEGAKRALLMRDGKTNKLAIKPVGNDPRAYSIIRGRWQTRLTTKKWLPFTKPGVYQAVWNDTEKLLEVDLNKRIE